MALKTEIAWEALHQHLASLVGDTLPACLRNEDILTSFSPSPDPRYRWGLWISDSDIRTLNVVMGEAPQYELGAEVDIVIAVEGEPGAARTALLAGALETLKGALFPDGLPLAIDDKFDGLETDDTISRKSVPARDGAPPVNGWEFTAVLLLTASSPLG